MHRAIAFLLVVVVVGGVGSAAHGAWGEGGWPFRRAVDVEWEAEKGMEDELAEVEFNTLGLHESSGEHVRVTNEAGNPLPARVLMIGPGDQMRVIFRMVRGGKRYYVYFGHPRPPIAPKALEDLPITRGLLLEMYKYRGPMAQNFKQIETAWDRKGALIGRELVPFLYLGHNPFDDQVGMVARYTGVLDAPVNGEYTIAAAASDKAAIYIDEKPVLFVPSAPGDTRFRAKVELKRGKHQVRVDQMNVAGEQRLSVVWSRPDDKQFKLIPPEAFGLFHRGVAGPLESNGKQYLADFKIEYLGECYFDGHYTHRYRLTGAKEKPGNPRTSWEWDFGDGQVGSGATVEHVYLGDGEYTVKLAMRSGLQNDARANRIVVSRLWEKIDNPPGDLPSVQGKVIADYDVGRIPAAQLQWAVLLNERARQDGPLEKCAIRLAGMSEGMDAAVAMGALGDASAMLAARGHVDVAERIWEAVPKDSPFQPFGVKHQAELLLWRVGDFGKAMGALEPFLKMHPNDPGLKRLYGEALVLNQRAGEGRKMLEGIAPEAPVDRQAALTGALARTIEFYIGDGDWEAGEQAWEKWEQQYPADFMEGYSVLLRTRLMELAKSPVAAAKVAEAFATAVPKSSYAPRLLDRASKLLESSDPAKSKALRDVLKKNYPEDPLAQ